MESLIVVNIYTHMSCRHDKVGATKCLDSPVLLVIKVGVTSKNGEEGVSQSATLPIKRVIIPMITFFKPDLYVSVSAKDFLKLEIGHI